MDNIEEFNINKDEEIGKRIDQFLTEVMNEYSRSYIKKLIDDKKILINNLNCKASYKLRNGDCVKIFIPELKELDIKPQKIQLDIVYEDDHLLVVNKSQGMVVHPAPGNYEDTLVNSLLYHVDNLSGINGILRPGIVHRIDKFTTGLLLVAKSDLAHKSLTKQLKEHTINRKYMALVEGIIIEEKGTVDAPIGRHKNNRKKMTVTDRNSKKAITHFSVLKRYNKYTLIEAKLETGRTHQIRVHMSFINHPVVGDPTYGYKKQKLYSKGQLLHAYLIGFNHPQTDKYMEFEASLPDYFQNVLEEIADV